MNAKSEQHLLNIVDELQQLRIQVHKLYEALATIKLEVVLTAKARTRKRRRRKPPSAGLNDN